MTEYSMTHRDTSNDSKYIRIRLLTTLPGSRVNVNLTDDTDNEYYTPKGREVHERLQYLVHVMLERSMNLNSELVAL